MHGSGAACLLFLLPFFAQAQVAVPPVGQPAQTQQADAKTAVPEQHALEASDLEAFFDGIVPLSSKNLIGDDPFLHDEPVRESAQGGGQRANHQRDTEGVGMVEQPSGDQGRQRGADKAAEVLDSAD